MNAYRGWVRGGGAGGGGEWGSVDLRTAAYRERGVKIQTKSCART